MCVLLLLERRRHRRHRHKPSSRSHDHQVTTHDRQVTPIEDTSDDSSSDGQSSDQEEEDEREGDGERERGRVEDEIIGRRDIIETSAGQYGGDGDGGESGDVVSETSDRGERVELYTDETMMSGDGDGGDGWEAGNEEEGHGKIFGFGEVTNYQDTVQDNIQDIVQDIVQDTIQDTIQDIVQDTIQDTSHNIDENASQDRIWKPDDFNIVSERISSTNPFDQPPPPVYDDDDFTTPTADNIRTPDFPPPTLNLSHPHTTTTDIAPAPATPSPPDSSTSSDFLSEYVPMPSCRQQPSPEMMTGDGVGRRVSRTDSLEWSMYIEQNMADGVDDSSPTLQLEEDYYSAEVYIYTCSYNVCTYNVCTYSVCLSCTYRCI